MKIYVNSLIFWNDSDLTTRVLFNDGEFLVTINIFAHDAFPEIHPLTEIAAAFEARACRILDKDPFDFILIHESQIKSGSKDHRDRAWSAIEKIVTQESFSIFSSQGRGPLLRQAAKDANLDLGTVYRYVRKYWQRGLTKNALLPQFSKCGGKGKPRLGNSVTDEKLGRPSALSITTGETRGLRMTEETYFYFRLGLDRFYKTRKEPSLAAAFQETLEKFFHIGFEFQGDILVPIMPDASQLPTFRQFLYFFYTKYADSLEITKARKGKIDFLLNYRELIGNSTDMAFGPGSLFQIDATVADTYLLSADRRLIIGRPVVYLVVDVFSRMIVGMSVILEGPSWVGGMLALDNTFSDKVRFCAEYGIEITHDQWPCHYLPKAILADRGEFEGYNVEPLISVYGMRVYNSPPYRADLKGIVEQQFRILNVRFVSFIPGFVYKTSQPGGTGLQARCLTHSERIYHPDDRSCTESQPKSLPEKLHYGSNNDR